MSCIFTSYEEQKVGNEKPKMSFDGELTIEKKLEAPLKNYACQEKEHFSPSRCDSAWFKCSIADDCPIYQSYLVDFYMEAKKDGES